MINLATELQKKKIVQLAKCNGLENPASKLLMHTQEKYSN